MTAVTVVDLTVDLSSGHCTTLAADTFFPRRGTAQLEAKIAKDICNGASGGAICPVRELCLEVALARRERIGVWGGKSERERTRILKFRKAEIVRLESERLRKEERRKTANAAAWVTRRARASELENVGAVVHGVDVLIGRRSRRARTVVIYGVRRSA